MATPTLSFAAISSAKKSPQKISEKNKTSEEDSFKSAKDENGIYSPLSKLSLSDTKLRKFWGEEVNEEAIYSVYLKKINYSSNCNTNNYLLPSKIADFKPLKGYSEFYDTLNGGTDLTKCDQVDRASSVNATKPSEAQCLQWETRQTRILKAATLDHIVKYILLLTSHQNDQNSETKNCNGAMHSIEDERNNVAHAMHVFFCIYRLYCSPRELYDSIMKFSTESCARQFNFVIHYWMDNYPEDFRSPFSPDTSNDSSSSSFTSSEADMSHSSSSTSTSMSGASSSSTTSSSDCNPKKRMLIDIILLQHKNNNSLYRKGLTILDMREEQPAEVVHASQKSIGKSSSVLELDPRFIAQQLTAIDLENFLSLKPYSLLTGSRSTPKIQSMIRNFNLLSRHVIITILKSHSPHIVTTHWIEVALQLRKIRNFNSLKAIIAGLTNESVYRLKQIVWSKLSRATMSTFKWLSTIVDDVNNQTLLRHTQLIIEGTSKVSLEDESFGTIPYLGTFLTDITVIDSKYPSYIQSANNNNIRLINFEKCSQQYEILMQIQLLQKNVIAALTSLQQQTQQITRIGKPPSNSFVSPPQVPRVARIFRVWFQSKEIASYTDKQCYELSLALESTPVKNK